MNYDPMRKVQQNSIGGYIVNARPGVYHIDREWSDIDLDCTLCPRPLSYEDGQILYKANQEIIDKALAEPQMSVLFMVSEDVQFLTADALIGLLGPHAQNTEIWNRRSRFSFSVGSLASPARNWLKGEA